MSATNKADPYSEPEIGDEENESTAEVLTLDGLPQYRWRSRGVIARGIEEKNHAGGGITREEDSALSLYIRAAGKVGLLSREEELELARRSEAGDPLAQHKLITANLRLVMKFAKGFMNRGLDLEDLIQEGNMGLIRAAQLFKVEKGVKFSTYASMWIIQSIVRAIDNKSRIVRLPVTLIRDIKKIRRISNLLQQTSGSTATLEELARHSKLSLQRVKIALQSNEQPLSLNHESEIGGSELGEHITYENGSAVEDAAERNLGLALFQTLSEVLLPEELKVIALRYGLIDQNEMSYQQIGTLLSWHASKAKRTHDAAINKMQQKNIRLAGQARMTTGKKLGEFAL